MSDLANEAVTLSTTIDEGPGPSAAGGGQPKTLDEGKPASLRDDIAAAFREEDAKAEKADARPVEVKDDRKADPAKDEKPENAPEKAETAAKEPAGSDDDKTPKADAKPDPEADAEKARKDERRHVEPPSKFLPRAKELWPNTPREVQREVERITREHEAEVHDLKLHSERYQSLREFDEMAKSNGRDLRESLIKINHIENTLARNPIAGLNAILMEIGPRKPDGQPVSLFEIATHIVNQGQDGYQRMVAAQPQQQQQRQPDPEVAALRTELEQMKMQQVAATIVEPFARAHPRYQELQADIAFFLNSGKIPQSLSPQERLEAAYDMAERINPRSIANDRQADEGLEQPARRADPDFSGSKSIKSGPGSVSDDAVVEAKGDESIRDSLLKEMRRLKLS